MSSFSVAQFVAISAADGTRLHSWQNAWIDRTVNGHTFYPVGLSSLVDATGGEFVSVAMTLPLGSDAMQLLDQGIDGRYQVLIEEFKYDGSLDAIDPTAGVKTASFYGEVIGGSINATSAQIQVGSRLDAVEGQMPARLYTAVLVGRPPKI
jgi:hypothetical protein